MSEDLAVIFLPIYKLISAAAVSETISNHIGARM